MAHQEQGCQYREHEGQSTCNKLCNPGETLCPYHQILTAEAGAELDTVTKTYKTPRGYQQ
jgi:hypothetical protein